MSKTIPKMARKKRKQGDLALFFSKTKQLYSL